MDIVYDQLENNCTEDELSLISNIIEEAAGTREQELRERRNKKWRNIQPPSERRTGGSGGGNQPPPPPPPPAQQTA